MTHLNSDHLRTFLAIAQAGSVTGGAAQIARSQSATSLQVRLLEDVVGQPLFLRHGRGVSLSPAGEKLLPVAREVVRSLDATLSELRGDGLKGILRIGVSDTYSRSVLADIISTFATLHPDVVLDVHCALGTGFAAALRSGALDLAVHDVPEPNAGDLVLRTDHLVWMQREQSDFADAESLPIAVFDRACWWRDAALAGLESEGRRFHIAFTSESVSGVRAAVQAGFAVGFLNGDREIQGLKRVAGLTRRCATHLVLQTSSTARGPICDAMRAAIQKAFAA